MENKLEQEIQSLYARTDKTQSYEDFAKLYRADKGNNTEGMFTRLAKLKEVDPAKGIDFSKARPAKSNLTEEQAEAHAARRAALEVPTHDTPKVKLAKEKIEEIEAELKKLPSYFSASGVDKQRQVLLTKAKDYLNHPHKEKYAALKQHFAEAFNIEEKEYGALSDKQRADKELDIAIAIKNKKIACPAGYTPVKCTLLDEIRRQKGW